jgi:hypothetical protein
MCRSSGLTEGFKQCQAMIPVNTIMSWWLLYSRMNSDDVQAPIGSEPACSLSQTTRLGSVPEVEIDCFFRISKPFKHSLQ